MWWRSSAIIAALFAGLAALALAGCGFQPLYGGTTAGGAKLSEVMATVDITPIPGRSGAITWTPSSASSSGRKNPAGSPVP